ncbi:MAG: 50S ribosomal protein L29 [Acidobacteriota bacterium]|jgi:large subunit ribosomal protein L29|nr:50S ribosomal protein L29 [Acidobacteriota bacterium]
MKAKEIRAMTADEIENKLIESRDKIFKQRMQKALGQAENPFKIRSTRRDIAKMKTILAEKRSENVK